VARGAGVPVPARRVRTGVVHFPAMVRTGERIARAELRYRSYLEGPAVHSVLRGVRRLLQRFDLDRISVDCDGLSLTGGLAERALLLGTARNTREAFSLRLWASLAEPGLRAVDVGAHIGVFTLLAARGVGPAGHVWAVEPHPQSFRHLGRNVRKNGFDNVTAIRAAASDRPGSATLMVLAGDRTQSSVVDLGQPLDARFEVVTARLDDLVGDARADVMKIDTEGNELSVLRGAPRLLSSLRAVIVECNGAALRAAGSSPRDLLAVLEDQGFVTYAVDEDRWSLIPRAAAADWPRGVYNVLAVRPDAHVLSVIESLDRPR
jgi:FkbM family methyltransferase